MAEGGATRSSGERRETGQKRTSSPRSEWLLCAISDHSVQVQFRVPDWIARQIERPVTAWFWPERSVPRAFSSSRAPGRCA
jgi:hypothetical protein